MRWTVPKLWPGATVFIIGGGPSVTTTDLSLIHGRRVIGVNDACFLGPWVDVAFFGDCNWYDWNHRRFLRTFHGLRVTVCQRHAKKPGILWVERGKPAGLELERADRLGWNRSSGACAVDLAYHLGAARIVLIGFDMQKVGGACNYHSNHKTKQVGDPYPRFIRYFKHIAGDAKKAGLEIWNATPGSAMEHFPVMTLEEAVSRDAKERAAA